MKLHYNILLILILVPIMALASPEKFKGKYTKEKTIKKEFSVNAKAGLKVNNSYGNIDIVTWGENRTVIEVFIKTNGNDEEEVQRKLDEIKVDFTANGSLVTAITKFNEEKSSWKFWGNKNSSISMEINYAIKLPVTNTVDLNNDYGTISINKLEGNAKINCDYGQLIIGELLADDNYLTFDYTDNSTITYMKSGKIDADYSGFTLDKTERVEIAADYTHSEVLEAKDVNYNCDYGKVTIQKVGELIGRGNYVTVRLGTVSGSVNLNSDYGSIKIDEITNTAKNVTLNGDYTGIKMGFSPSYHFNFVVDLSYAGFTGENDLTVTKSSKDYTHKTYSGYHGKENSGNTVNINSDYGSVTLSKN